LTGPIGPGVRVQVVGAWNAMDTEWWSLEQQPVSYYREAAARAWSLHAEATTPRLKQYLSDVIARCERLAEEVDSASRKD
jgi:hypothetical protein